MDSPEALELRPSFCSSEPRLSLEISVSPPAHEVSGTIFYGDPERKVTANGLVPKPSHPRPPALQLGPYLPWAHSPLLVIILQRDNLERFTPVAFYGRVTANVICPQPTQRSGGALKSPIGIEAREWVGVQGALCTFLTSMLRAWE